MSTTSSSPVAAKTRLSSNPGLVQFLKFCIVGASSTLIDVGLSTVLIKHFHWPWAIASIISFTLGVSNGYYWNQRWTFKKLGHGPTHEQYMRFMVVNIIGLGLNLTIVGSFFKIVLGMWNPPSPSLANWLEAKFIATCVVVFWNYNMSKRWTFKHPEESIEPLTA